jgi:hypothetical protein
MEVKYSSETSVDYQRTARRYITEDRNLHNHGCENIISYTVLPYGEATYPYVWRIEKLCISSRYLLHAGFLFGLFFDREEGEDKSFRNVGLSLN